MGKKVTITNLQGSTLDILNVIRTNASAEYQSLVPEVTKEVDIPKVGEVLVGYPQMANQFISVLVNRIVEVRVKSAIFTNRFAKFKKGTIPYGQTIEEVFVELAKAREFSVEKAASREFKRTLPKVKAAFHTMNYQAQYPITIQDEDLRTAFLNASGVQDLIAKIVKSVYVAADYDEYLLCKYLIIKAVSHGKMKAISIGDGTDLKKAAKQFRRYANQLTVDMTGEYNAEHVKVTTPIEDQYIFLDTDFEADFDVNVLSAAFNMDKAMYMGKRELIDSWDTFDSERFSEIIANSDQMEPVTSEELALMKNVKAVLLDGEWFQLYDNLNKFTETYVASGMYWNYFYNVRKTVSSSPFSNAIVFVTNAQSTELPNEITVEVADKSISEESTNLVLLINDEEPAVVGANGQFVQGEDATSKTVAVYPYGGLIFPAGQTSIEQLDMIVDGVLYTSATTSDHVTYTKAAISTSANVGDTITFVKADKLS